MNTLVGLCSLQDTFTEAVASAGVPRVQVAIHDPSLTPKLLEIVTDEGVLSQRVVVIGQPNQRLR